MLEHSELDHDASLPTIRKSRELREHSTSGEEASTMEQSGVLEGGQNQVALRMGALPQADDEERQWGVMSDMVSHSLLHDETER